MPKPALRMDAQEIGTYWANRWQPLREVGGRLMLTDQRLVFYAHMIDRATGGEDWACELAAIIGVEASERRSTFRRDAS